MSFWNILLLFGIPTSVTTLLFFLLRKYFSSKIDLATQKSFAAYKQKLSIVSETAKLDLQKKMQDFNLYTSKKHEKYMEYHKLLLLAESNVNGLYGFKQEPTYEEYNDVDLRRIMKESGFPQGKIEEIFKIIYSKEREQAIKEMKKFLRLIEFQKANRAVIEAKNYYWTSKLYFSDEIDKLTINFISLLNEIYGINEMLYDWPHGDSKEKLKYSKKSRELKKKTDKLLLQIISQMKTELSIGYYEQKNT